MNAIVKKYHHYELWEDYLNGMYRTVSGVEFVKLLDKALQIMTNVNIFGDFMMAVVKNWQYCSEHNLTDIHINQRAWIGQAACCFACGITEDVTRKAWGMLSDVEREKANKKADEAIEYWNENKNIDVYSKVGKSGVSIWNSRRSKCKVGINREGSIIQNDMPSNPKERFCFNQLGLF